jgi:hypothetical protein
VHLHCLRSLGITGSLIAVPVQHVSGWSSLGCRIAMSADVSKAEDGRLLGRRDSWRVRPLKLMVAINDRGRAEGATYEQSIEFGSFYVGVTDPMFLTCDSRYEVYPEDTLTDAIRSGP